MPTPDFEDWLERQEIPIEETLTVENYQKYLAEEFGIKDGSLDVAAGVYETRYAVFPQLEIRPITRHYEFRGEPFTETRYGIKGYPGLWGKTEAYRIAGEKAEAAGLFETAEIMRRTYAELLGGE